MLAETRLWKPAYRRLRCRSSARLPMIRYFPTIGQILSTGQNPQSPQEILEFLGEVEGDVTQEIEAMAEEGLERSPKGFFKGIGRS